MAVFDTVIARITRTLDGVAQTRGYRMSAGQICTNGDYVGLASDGLDFSAFFQQYFVSDPADGFFRRVIP